KATAELLRMFQDLAGRQSPAGGDGEAEQPAAGIELAAAGAGQPVDEIAPGRVALGQQHRPGPHQGQREARRGDPRCSLVRGDGNEPHRWPARLAAGPGSTATATLLLAALQVTTPATDGLSATRTSMDEELVAAGGTPMPSTTAFDASVLPGVPG